MSLMPLPLTGWHSASHSKRRAREYCPAPAFQF